MKPNFAEQYDLEHISRIEDINFYLQVTKDLPDPILDIGCGTGRISIPLIQTGRSVHCFDKSEFMLDHLRNKMSKVGIAEGKRIQIIQGNMPEMNIEKPYPVIICTFNTFLNLITAKDIDTFLGSIKKLMRKDSYFIFDLIYPNTAYLVDSTEFKLEKENIKSGKTISRRYYRTLEHDPNRQVARVEFKTVLYNEQGHQVEEWFFKYTTAYHTESQVIEILQRNGFSTEYIYGDYKMNLIEKVKNPQNQVFICKLK